VGTVSEVRLRRQVLFHETDMAGMVHFSCYFKYMEEAEHMLWRTAGLSVAPKGATVGWPRVAASFEFRRPLRFEDEFDIHVRITSIGTRSLGYACRIHRGDQTIASGTMQVACVSHDGSGPMRAVDIPSDVRARLVVATGDDES
jgi:YbgC/YbaW family acyl-CoA thioester hydrolase